MKTKIIKIKGDWKEVRNDCRNTVSKGEIDSEVSENFKLSLLLSEHSPIRSIVYKWKWEQIPSWVATHWSRHKWECFISTRRSDRTGVDRNELTQGELVDFIGEANQQQLIDTMRKRLCFKASPETRELAEDLVDAIREYDPLLAKCLVPNCIYRMDCTEECTCGYFEEVWGNCDDAMGFQHDLNGRYSVYDAFRRRK